MGDEPAHGTGPGKLPAQVCHEDYREVAKATGGWGIGVPTTGDINIRGRFSGYGWLCPEEEEYCCTVHRDAANSRPLREEDAEVGVMSS